MTRWGRSGEAASGLDRPAARTTKGRGRPFPHLEEATSAVLLLRSQWSRSPRTTTRGSLLTPTARHCSVNTKGPPAWTALGALGGTRRSSCVLPDVQRATGAVSACLPSQTSGSERRCVAALRARRRRLRARRFGYARRVEKHSLGAAVVQALVSDCRACGSACETILESWSDERCARGDYGRVVAGAATFAVIADQLETGGTIPPGLVIFAITFADTTCRVDTAARSACAAASDLLRELFDG